VAPAAPVDCVEFDKALARLGGNGSLYHSLVRTFAGEARVLLEKLEAAIESGHLAEAGNVLRNFRSAAGIVGASRLGAIAIEEEQRLRAPGARLDGEAAQALLARVGKLTEQTLAELDQVLEKQRA
jgi:HPt (histidine-containing phosphotransfer) domain-containing protein